jgi:asparagine N-glycosylation enzyme membrane subunit Stt3
LYRYTASLSSGRTDARIFVAAYFLVAGYFSAKMVRLVLLLGPAAACTSGVALGALMDWVAAEIATLAEVGLYKLNLVDPW